MGLHRAGFEVVGFDIEPQKNYPFEFHQQDVIKEPPDLTSFDAVWASPPCQGYTQGTAGHRTGNRGYQAKQLYPDLIEATRQRIKDKPYIIENVVGAPLHDAVRLCGTMFGLMVLRHRLFECPFTLTPPLHKIHWKGMTTRRRKTETPCNGPYFTVSNCALGTKAQWSEAMGIDWMTRDELIQAVPPAYSEFFGRQLIQTIESA